MFWDDSLSYFGAALPGGPASRGAASMFWNLRRLTAANQLTALVSGAAAYAGEEAAEEKLRDDALKVLRTLFGEEAVQQPAGVVATRWLKEEFSKGAPSHGSMPASRQVVCQFWYLPCFSSSFNDYHPWNKCVWVSLPVWPAA